MVFKCESESDQFIHLSDKKREPVISNVDLMLFHLQGHHLLPPLCTVDLTIWSLGVCMVFFFFLSTQVPLLVHSIYCMMDAQVSPTRG